MSENKAETNKKPKEKPAPKEFKKNPINGIRSAIETNSASEEKMEKIITKDSCFFLLLSKCFKTSRNIFGADIKIIVRI